MDEQQETRTVRREYGQANGESIAQARRVIDQIENAINDSRRVPMSKTLSFVDTGEIIDLIGQLRIVLPHAVVQAQAIMDEKERILSEAKAEADKIADTADTSYKTTIDEANRFKQEVHDEADAYDRQVRQKAEEDATAIVADRSSSAHSSSRRGWWTKTKSHGVRRRMPWKRVNALKRMRTASIIRHAYRWIKCSAARRLRSPEALPNWRLCATSC